MRRKLGIASFFCAAQRPAFLIKQAYSLFESLNLHIKNTGDRIERPVAICKTGLAHRTGIPLCCRSVGVQAKTAIIFSKGIDTVSTMIYNIDADIVSIIIADRGGDAMMKGTPALIAGRREEIINACEKLYEDVKARREYQRLRRTRLFPVFGGRL